MKKIILLVLVVLTFAVTGCGEKKVILGHDEPEFRPIEVEKIIVETIETETIIH